MPTTNNSAVSAQDDTQLEVSYAHRVVPLPPELLSIIFLYIHHHTSDGLSAKDTSRLPLIVSHVSQLWRDVALSIAALWTDIYISPPCSLDLLSIYLDRSGSHSLDLSILLRHHNQPTGFGDIRSVAALCSILGPHLYRCHSISIESYGNWGARDKLLDLFSAQSFPHLQRFAIDSPYPSLMLAGSNLTELRIRNWFSSLSGLPFKLFTDNITVLHLDAEHLEYSLLYSLLTKCPALSTLALYNDCTISWPTVHTPNLILLSDLHSLQLYAFSITATRMLLVSLIAPNLDDLVIAPVKQNGLRNLQYEFLDVDNKTPKFPRLKSLTMAPATAADYNVLLAASRCFPSVVDLTLPNMHYKPFAHLFTSGKVLWPQLRTLALRGIDRKTEELVVKMVQFRKSEGFPLDTLYLDFASLGVYVLPFLRTQLSVRERDVWEIRRREALYSEFPKRFLSRKKQWELE